MTIQELINLPSSPLTDSQKKDLEEECKSINNRAIACLEVVKAMLENTHGATHRMKDFYTDAIEKYIENVKEDLSHRVWQYPF